MVFRATHGDLKDVTSINEGLSQSTVFSIDQDKKGNMRFATYDRVNKYDGRIVKTDCQGRIRISTPLIAEQPTQHLIWQTRIVWS